MQWRIGKRTGTKWQNYTWRHTWKPYSQKKVCDATAESSYTWDENTKVYKTKTRKPLPNTNTYWNESIWSIESQGTAESLDLRKWHYQFFFIARFVFLLFHCVVRGFRFWWKTCVVIGFKRVFVLEMYWLHSVTCSCFAMKFLKHVIALPFRYILQIRVDFVVAQVCERRYDTVLPSLTSHVRPARWSWVYTAQ